MIKKALKERLSLRGICRIFGVSLSWLQSFAHYLWEQTPERLGLSSALISRIKKLQVFGIQADELWRPPRGPLLKRKIISVGFGLPTILLTA